MAATVAINNSKHHIAVEIYAVAEPRYNNGKY